MSQINPFSGYLATSSAVQRQQAASKDQQVRRRHDLAKNIALEDDQLEHQVESSEELRPVHDQSDEQHPRRKKNDPPARPRLDLKA